LANKKKRRNAFSRLENKKKTAQKTLQRECKFEGVEYGHLPKGAKKEWAPTTKGRRPSKKWEKKIGSIVLKPKRSQAGKGANVKQRGAGGGDSNWQGER